jgi:hypothetical protein
MKRFLAALLLTTSTGVASASASSFVVLPAMQEKLGPSMIALGTPAPAAETVAARAAAEPAPASSATPDRIDAADAFTLAAAAMLSETPAAPAPTLSAVEDTLPAGSFVAISPSIIAMGEIPPPVSFEQVSAVGKAAPGRRFEQKPMVIRGGDVGEAFSYGSGVPTKEGRSGRQTASTSDGAPDGAPGKPEPQKPATAPIMPRTQVE